MQEIKDLLKEQIKQTKLQNQLIAGGFLLLAKYLGPMHRTAILQEQAESDIPDELNHPWTLSETYHDWAWRKYGIELLSLFTLEELSEKVGEDVRYMSNSNAKSERLCQMFEKNGIDLADFLRSGEIF